MSFRPCIDLHEGKVKQIVGSTLDSGGLKTNFVSEKTPSYYAELYRRDALRGGHVIMLGGGCEEAAREALAAWPGNLQIGGGITPANASKWIEVGADKVIVTSWCFPEGKFAPECLKELLNEVGKEHLVLDLSCRRKGDDYFVAANRWRTYTDLKVNRETLEMLADSAAEFLIHAVDVEGKQAGIDCELLELLSKDSPIECVYAGGIRTLEDVALIEKSGSGKVHYTIGSALDIFGGPLSYRDVVAHSRKN
ncbi:MAG: phosphoribosylformimino-5-aminoimidazole carboxamide ribotide isomerase [Lentisphaerae bacterium]|nr:phosphoribosylformimino-5-aminoimidazole carboxamide ribotide isomerase [Lentisphaerota bacterium]